MPPAYLRHPHLQGDTLVLVAEDDVWIAPVAGGRAWRLTADGEPASRPRLSPDGTRVAWTSRREGAPEVFVTDLDGGGVLRLTWWGDPTTRLLGWDGPDAVVASSATGQPAARYRWPYRVPAAGGTPERLPLGPVGDLARRPEGPTVLLTPTLSREMAWQKRYRGGTTGKLWWDAAGSGDFVRLAAELDGNLDAPMLVGDRIAFLSDHEGWGNVYSLGPDGTGLRRHTDHGAEGSPAFYARHAATDGERVVYESAGELRLLPSPAPDAVPERIDVRLGGPRSAREPYRIRTADWLRAVAPDRTGRSSVALVRGTVHRLTHRDGPARTLFARPGARARLAGPLGDDRAVWVDDALGEDAVCVAPLDPRAEGAAAEQRFGAGELGRVLELEASPDGSAIALTTHDGRLLVLDPATGDVRELLRSTEGEPVDVTFSPDGAWLAFCEPQGSGLSRIVLADLADGTLVPVTDGRFTDASPAFTLDGKHLAFLSRRSFDPVYDEHAFDLTFPASWRPFLVPLAARTPSPFGASADGRPVTAEEEGPEDPPAIDDGGDGASPAAGDGAADGADGVVEEGADAADGPAVDGAAGEGGKQVGKPRKDAPPEVVVDVEGLAARVVPIPVVEARYSGMSAAKDCLLWVRFPIGGVLGDGRAGTDAKAPKPVLERFDLARRKVDVVADPVTSYAVSGDGTRLVVRDGDALRLLRSDRSSSGPPEESDAGADEFEIDTKRIVVTVDPSAEWRQMYDEAGRLMRDHFWVADMAGVDWAGELARYRPLVDAVGSHDDLVDLLWEVQGELATSHAYVIAGRGDTRGRPGFLGADLEAAADGWRVVRVLPPETSDPAARSPLSSPGVDVRAGDVILEVGGQPVEAALGPAPLLVGRAGELVELTVRTGPDRDGAGEVRRVAVRPLASEEALRYQDWVAGRRAAVVERSGGRLGYLHVPDMAATGWAQLHRDFARETARDGLILDVRDNGGGHTSELVIEKLARKVIGWDTVRHRPARSYPQDAPRGPIVAVADEFAGSDGDIVTAAIKRMGLGPVVGTRTWGGVIGIDGRYGLVDGTRVTQPRYSFWFDDLGWGVENHGVDPDVEVVVTPQDWVAGRDPQLERAVDLALEALAQRPAARPPDPATRPDRTRPALPPRP